VNYPDLKDGASNFNGSRTNTGFSSSLVSNIASVSSTGDSRRYQSLLLKRHILGGIDFFLQHS
jgi:hypothetical protein